MNTTSSHLPICVHCGTPRPADETLCPTCGKPWIDTTIPETIGHPTTPVPPGVPAAGDTSPDEADLDGDADGDADAQDTSDRSPGAAAVAAAVAATAHRGAKDDDDPEPTGEATRTDDDDSTNAAPAPAGAGVPGAAVAAAAAADGAGGDGSGDDIPDHIPSGSDTVAETSPPPPAFGLEDTGEFAFGASPESLEEKERRGTAWLVPAGIGVAILAVLAVIVFGGNSTTTTTVAAVDTTIASVSTTTSPSTTTTVQTTTTTVAIPQPGDWSATGTPIDIADLTFKASAIGPIEVGMPIGDVAGVLTTSLGEATESGVDGLCPPDESYWLRFGQLTAIFDGFDDTAAFVSYRYDEPEGSNTDIGLKTLSGIALGDTVEDLINTYTQFTISFEIIDSKDYFRLTDGGDLLLWGPLSSADLAGLIEGIYSPTACDSSS